jgi:hypothetical protein
MAAGAHGVHLINVQRLAAKMAFTLEPGNVTTPLLSMEDNTVLEQIKRRKDAYSRPVLHQVLKSLKTN